MADCMPKAVSKLLMRAASIGSLGRLLWCILLKRSRSESSDSWMLRLGERRVRSGIGSLQIGNSNWAIWLVFVYLWLPYVMLPIYGALERIPGSYLEASSDLGARGWRTFRSIIMPLALPGIVAGSIFAFSLTLGDYIAPQLVGNTKFIGSVVYDSVGVANNVPFAAALALVPVAIMAVYLLVAKRLGAFESL